MSMFCELCSELTIGYQYSKAVGSARPKSVIRLETVIWENLFAIARGQINVYEASKSIAQSIPDILDNLEDHDRSWFHLGSPNIF